MSKFSLKLAAVAALLASAGAANAITTTFTFNTLQAPSIGTLLPQSAGTLSFTDIVGGVAVALTSSTGWLGSTSTITELNVKGLDYTSVTGFSAPSGSALTTTDGSNAGFAYNWSLNLPPPGTVLATNGVVTFNLFGAGLDATDFTGAMIHVQRLSESATNTYGQPSIKITGVTAVPEPETYALMLAGLGVMCFIARRRKQQA